MKVQAINDGLGAIISDINLSTISNTDKQELNEALWKYKVISVVDQTLQQEDLEKVANIFGDFKFNSFFKVERKSSEQSYIFGGAWHADLSYLDNRPTYTMLYSAEVPEEGGDTLFADQSTCLEQFEPKFVEHLLTLKCKHLPKRYSFEEAVHSKGTKSYGAYEFFNREYSDEETQRIYKSESIFETISERSTEFDQKVLITHPHSNNLCLNVNPSYTKSILGMEEDESDKLLNLLFQAQIQNKYIYRLKWKNGMFTIWDNRQVLHKATYTHDSDYRLMFRYMAIDPSDAENCCYN